jgi:predicted Zn-dependent peptidase
LEFREHRLPNGLQVIAEVNPEAHSTAVGFFVETGARDESDDVAGVSHFLEHMVFKGTPSRSADDVNREFDEMGAHYNAFTSEECTVYYAAVLPEHQTPAVALLADIIRPSLREEDFNTEKKVIIEEIRMYEDSPPFGADEKCKAAHFGKHPLARSVLGTVESITDLSVDAMRSYFRQRYSPGNMVLVGAGKIDFDQFVRTAEQACGAWQPVKTSRQLVLAAAHSGLGCIEKKSATLEYVVQLAGAPDARDADRYAAKILATILGDDSGSRLYWALVDSGLADQASLTHYDYQGTGLFMTYLSCEADLAAANLAEIAKIYRQAEAAGITAAELSQAKNKINSRVVLASEKPRGRLFNVGNNWLQRRIYRSVQDDLELIDAVTRDDAATVLARFPLSVSTTLAIGPLQSLSNDAVAATVA